MKTRTLLMATASMAFAACFIGPVSAQNNAPQGAAAAQGNGGGAARPAGAPRSRLRHLLYIAVPGDEGADDQSGVIVLDADHDYRFVKRISYDLPAAKMPGPKISGMTSSVPENKIYVTTDGGDMLAIDLNTDKIAWDFQGEPGKKVTVVRPGSAADGCCERPYTLPGDGEHLLVASSYNGWWWFINAKTGKIEGRIDTPLAPRSHNVTVTADGKMAALASLSGAPDPRVAIADLTTKKVVCNITFSDAPRPLTMNHDGSLIYVNVNNLDGFEIADTKTCKMIKRVELPGEMWKAKWANPNGHYYGHGLPSHGIGMTPDESEIWVTDGANDAWQIWDNPGDGRNPVFNPMKTIPIQPGVGSAWISMTNDGKLAFVGDGSVIDVRAHKVITTLKDEYGHPIHAVEKVLYMTFDNGKMVDTSNQFAIGMKDAYDARMAKEKDNKQASN